MFPLPSGSKRPNTRTNGGRFFRSHACSREVNGRAVSGRRVGGQREACAAITLLLAPEFVFCFYCSSPPSRVALPAFSSVLRA